LGELVPPVCPIPDRQEVTSVDTELHSRKDRDTYFVASLLEDRIPINPVVIRDSEDGYSRLHLGLYKLAGESLVRLSASCVAVPLLVVSWSVNLKIAQIEA
jgi:hypothetical protein